MPDKTEFGHPEAPGSTAPSETNCATESLYENAFLLCKYKVEPFSIEKHSSMYMGGRQKSTIRGWGRLFSDKM